MAISIELENAIDALEQAIDRKVCAEVDAGACGTKHDWDKAHEAQADAVEAREAVDALIRAELEHVRKLVTAQVEAKMKRKIEAAMAPSL